MPPTMVENYIRVIEWITYFSRSGNITHVTVRVFMSHILASDEKMVNAILTDSDEVAHVGRSRHIPNRDFSRMPMSRQVN